MNSSPAPPGPPPSLPAIAGSRPALWVDRWHKPVFLGFLVVSLVTLGLHGLRIHPTGGWRWIDLVELLLAVGTTLLGLGRRLPFQNVLMAAALIGSISAGILLVATVSGVPFGPIVYTDALGEKLFQVLPWPMPLIWVVILINARGVARLIMRPWRKTPVYGFWVIGLAGVLALFFDLGLEPVAIFQRRWWVWQPTRAVFFWHTAPWVNFLGWFVVAVAILLFTTPWLINKMPVRRPMDYQPLVVWLMLNLNVAVGNAAHGFWMPVWASLAGNGIAVVFAVRGARWGGG
jgi:uncharacterized membrane protein